MNAFVKALAGQLNAEWITAALARRRSALEAIEHEKRAQHWDANAALRIAHLWLVAGLPGRGDDLVLEADQLLPQSGVVPDWWGLWPATAGEPPALAQCYMQLRHLPGQEAWRAWLQAVQEDWRQIDAPEQRLLMGLVINGRAQLPGALEPALERLVGEEAIRLEPALAWRFFSALSERLPEWGYGRLKAADLSLERGALEHCRQQLQAATEEQWKLAWLHDVQARLTLAEGDVAGALAAWQQAMARCDQAEVLEIFRQRAREARRGPGVLHARSLLNRGDTAAAVALLEQLLEQDPQWQPLRSLLEQTRQPSTGQAPVAPGSELERLEARLRQLADRAALPWPEDPIAEGTDAAGFERFLHSAMGRLALLR